MAPQQECLTNVDLLEIILSSVSINTLTTVRRVARPWREAVDDSPTNAEIQKKQFYTPIWVWRWVKRPPPSLIIIAGLSVASQWYAQVKERHYLLIDVHPAFDPFHDDPYSASSFGFATPLKYVLNMQNSSFERAFVTQPPVAEVQIPQTDMMPACFWNVKIVAEGGVRFGDIIKAIGPLAKVIRSCTHAALATR